MEAMQRVKDYVLEQSRIKIESSCEELAPPPAISSDKTEQASKKQPVDFLDESKYACSPRNSSDEEVEELFFSELSQLFSRTRIVGLPPIPTLPVRTEREVIVESKFESILF